MVIKSNPLASKPQKKGLQTFFFPPNADFEQGLSANNPAFSV